MRAIIFNCTLRSSPRNVSMLPTKPIVPSFVTVAHRVKQCHRPIRAYGQKWRGAIMQGDEGRKLQSGTQWTPSSSPKTGQYLVGPKYIEQF